MSGKTGYVEDLVPIIEIRDALPPHEGAVAICKDKTCIMIMEASSINLDMMDDGEIDSILQVFGSMLDAMLPNITFQILITSNLQDPEAYFRDFQKPLHDVNTHENHKRMIEEQIQWGAQLLGAQQALNRRIYVVVGYGESLKPLEEKHSENIPGMTAYNRFNENKERERIEKIDPLTFEIARENLENQAATVRGFLARIGIQVVPLNERAIMELMYQFMRPGLAQVQKFGGGVSIGSLAGGGGLGTPSMRGSAFREEASPARGTFANVPLVPQGPLMPQVSPTPAQPAPRPAPRPQPGVQQPPQPVQPTFVVPPGGRPQPPRQQPTQPPQGGPQVTPVRPQPSQPPTQSPPPGRPPTPSQRPPQQPPQRP